MSSTDNKIRAEYDFELIVSRESTPSWKNVGEQITSVPVFYDPVKNSYYLYLNKNDVNYYQIISEAQKERLISSNTGYELIEYPNTINLKFSIHKMFDIPGVRGDDFSLRLGNKDYWRFQFFKENHEEVSEFILNMAEERKDIAEKRLQIEYLGMPHDLKWYLGRYRYGREVVAVKVLESLSAKFMELLPHYVHAFHYDLKSPDFGDGISKVIRFSDGTCESGGTLKDQVRIRNDKIVITEDSRTNLANTAYFDFQRKVFMPALQIFCDYDGNESVTTVIINKSDLNKLLRNIKQSNERMKEFLYLSLISIEDL